MSVGAGDYRVTLDPVFAFWTSAHSPTFGARGAEIIEFASEFDPQPYHLDPVAAEASIFGELCASGWQISALTQRMITDCFRDRKILILGLCGVKQLQWRKVNPGL